MKLFKLKFENYIRKYFMVNRFIDNCNLLNKEIVEVEKISTFKKKYDKYVTVKRGVNEVSPCIYY